mmetsp:Transcript_7495/g.19517  ORF Transcript_7495/g.19517 Transcript_7495/m.19517 type:complete len:227 (-) Transcript_7495:371-1051(-)
MRRGRSVIPGVVVVVLLLMESCGAMSTRWDPLRFARQALYFNQPMTPALAPVEGQRLFPRRGLEWGPLDDVIMGGASSSTWEATPTGTGVWRGSVTSANNGGFAGVRTRPLRPAVDASRFAGLKVKLTSDSATRFKFIVRDSDDWNGVAWTWCFDAPGGRPVEVTLPFAEAKPTKFAKVLTDAPPLDTARLTALQLTLSKFEFDGGLNPRFKEGDFVVDVEAIDLY